MFHLCGRSLNKSSDNGTGKRVHEIGARVEISAWLLLHTWSGAEPQETPQSTASFPPLSTSSTASTCRCGRLWTSHPCFFPVASCIRVTPEKSAIYCFLHNCDVACRSPLGTHSLTHTRRRREWRCRLRLAQEQAEGRVLGTISDGEIDGQGVCIIP